MPDTDDLIELVEANGNRMTRGEIHDEWLASFGGDEERLNKAINILVERADELAKDRYGGKDRIEKIVY